MELAKTLPTEAEATSLDGKPGAVTDGLSAAILAEEGEQAGDAGGSGGLRPVGRPPTHGRFSKAAGSDGHHLAPPPGEEPLPTAEVEMGPSARVTIPPDLLSRVVIEALSFGETGIANALDGQGRLAGLTSAEIEPQLQRAQLGDSRKKLVADLAPYAAEEWGLDVEVSPSLAIGMILGPWLFAAGSAYLTLSSLAKEKAERERKEKKA